MSTLKHVEAFKRQVGVPSRGVSVRLQLRQESGSEKGRYHLFVDGERMSRSYVNEDNAYHDAAIIREAMRRRVTCYGGAFKWVMKHLHQQDRGRLGR